MLASFRGQPGLIPPIGLWIRNQRVKMPYGLVQRITVNLDIAVKSIKIGPKKHETLKLLINKKQREFQGDTYKKIQCQKISILFKSR